MTNSEKITAALEIGDEILKNSDSPKLLKAIADVLEYLKGKLEEERDQEIQVRSVQDESAMAYQIEDQMPMFES